MREDTMSKIDKGLISGTALLTGNTMGATYAIHNFQVATFKTIKKNEVNLIICFL